MKITLLAVLICGVLIFAACGNSAKTTGHKVASAALFSTKDPSQSIGSAQFYLLADGQIKMDLVIDMKSRADSNVAVHFHEHGDCGDMGNAAHGHWNPTNEKHGKWGSASFHSGDIGNLKLDAKGHATISITTNRWSVNISSPNNIIDKAIIIHGGTDDYTSQPSGNSGPRVGCGVIAKS